MTEQITEFGLPDRSKIEEAMLGNLPAFAQPRGTETVVN